jgi:hypothetical protein
MPVARMKATVAPSALPADESLEAWVYKWTCPMDEELRIDPTDWQDVIQPRSRPVFTVACIAFCLCGLPSLLVAFLLPGWTAISLILGIPVCGLISAGCAHKRRERWPILRRMGTGFCSVWLFVVGFLLLSMMTG